MNRTLRRTLLFFGLVLFIILGPTVVWIKLNAMFAERSFGYQWRIDGGLRGLFHLASDLKLAADSDNVIREAAATRLLTAKQCDKQAGMLALLRSKRTDTMVRYRLMQTLAACGNQDVVPLLRQALRESEPVILIVAAQSAGSLHAREAIPELEALVERCSAQCAGSAAAALSRMGERRVAYPWAVKALSAERPKHDLGSEDSFARMYAGEVLQNIGTAADLRLIDRNRRSLGVFADYQKKEILDRQSKP